MHLLITGADRSLGRLAAQHFRDTHRLRLVGSSPQAPPDTHYDNADLCVPEQVAPLVKDVQAILHLAAFEPPAQASSQASAEQLDHAARGTYVLLDEARKSGVERVILASTLDVFSRCPTDSVIDERWRPRPKTEAAGLVPYLSEVVCREFAREGGIVAICLRFGHLGETEGTQHEDALAALGGSLVLPVGERDYRWRLYHVYSGHRFRTGSARRALKLPERMSN